MFERAETKSRQTLLRYQAIEIADYEALHHIHLWRHEPESKYIYYIGQSKHFETWYKNIKKEGDVIYKDFEEKSTFTKHVFKNADYDSFSIWKYDDSIDKFDEHIKKLHKKLDDIQEAKKLKKDIDVHIGELGKKFNDLKDLNL